MVRKLPDYICPIAICGGIPEGWNGACYKALAPKWGFFSEWKKDHDNEKYTRHFFNEVLSNLDPHDVLNNLLGMSNGKVPCMICYEKSGDFCHRHIVAEWLNQALPQTVKCMEYDFNRKRKLNGKAS